MPSSPSEASANRSNRILTYVLVTLLFVLAVVLLRTGWVCDDAYITLRTVDNFVEGYGPRWNIAERVQSYTHPLWMFLLASIYFFTREAYFTTLIVSGLLSLLAAALLVFRLAASRIGALLGLLILLMSKAFIDYATCGLENPLTNCLLAGLLIGYFSDMESRHKLLILSVTSALIALNRLDLLLVVAPFVVAEWKRAGWLSGLPPLVTGAVPLIVWEVFSLLYYGVPVPNTAYAKLSTGLSQSESIAQSVWYFTHSFILDPITLVTISAGLIVAFARRQRGDLPVAIAILLYLLYVVKVGGDFMSGRFFVAPLFLAVVLLSRLDFTAPRLRRLGPALFLLALVVGFSTTKNPILTGKSYGAVIDDEMNFLNHGGVADERGYYYQTAGLLNYDDSLEVWPKHRYAVKGARVKGHAAPVVFMSNIGYYGYFAGPEVYVYDPLALADPLVSHLPVVKDRWRVGHGFRFTPDGYLQSITNDTNVIRDSSLHKYYDVIRVLTRYPVFSSGRIGTILAFNLGQYDYLIDQYLNRPPPTVEWGRVMLDTEGGNQSDERLLTLQRSGVIVSPQRRLYGSRMSMIVDSDDTYQIRLLRDTNAVFDSMVESIEGEQRGREIDLQLGEAIAREGFDGLFVKPLFGDGLYWFGNVQLLP